MQIILHGIFVYNFRTKSKRKEKLELPGEKKRQTKLGDNHSYK